MDSDFVAIGIGAALLHRNDGFVGSVLQVRPYLVLVDVYVLGLCLLRHNSKKQSETILKRASIEVDCKHGKNNNVDLKKEKNLFNYLKEIHTI